MSCKKGGFVSERHDNIRDFLTIILNKVCVDVQAEPHLIPVTNEQFRLHSANTSDEARLDIKANGFWRQGETAFFDIKVTQDPRTLRQARSFISTNKRRNGNTWNVF